jgi:hypothetical protein
MKLIKKSRHHGEVAARTLEHLNQLTAEDLHQLAEFADRRFGSIPQHVAETSSD